MMGMHDAGKAEVAALRRRTLRLVAMERVPQEQGYAIVAKLDEVDGLIDDLQKMEGDK